MILRNAAAFLDSSTVLKIHWVELLEKSVTYTYSSLSSIGVNPFMIISVSSSSPGRVPFSLVIQELSTLLSLEESVVFFTKNAFDKKTLEKEQLD